MAVEDIADAYEMFMPQNMADVPHASKIQIFSDLQRTSVESPPASQACQEAMLGLAFAYATGYGVKSSAADFFLYIERSAQNGSLLAAAILRCLHGSDKRSGLLAISRMAVLDDPGLERQSACKFHRHTAETIDISSFSSADTCNPLHYLSLFEDSAVLHERDAVGPQLKSGFDYPSGKDVSSRRKRLRSIIENLGPQFVNVSVTDAHYLHPHFPLALMGTSLSFAVALGCSESVDALLLEGASPLSPVGEKDSSILERKSLVTALHTAVACHRTDMFNRLWSWVKTLERSGSVTTFFDYMKSNDTFGASIITALAWKSPFERALIHGLNSGPARQAMIRTVLDALLEMLPSQQDDNVSNRAVRMASKGVREMITLGDLSIAHEVMRELSLPGLCSYRSTSKDLEFQFRREIVDEALQIACSGSFDVEKSAECLDFAKVVAVRYNVNAAAIQTMMGWKAEDLLRYCLEHDHLTLHGVDEDGRTTLHHAVVTGFCQQMHIEEFLKRGIAIEHADQDGKTPLHLAVTHGMLETTKQLIDRGADPGATDKRGFPSDSLVCSSWTQNCCC